MVAASSRRMDEQDMPARKPVGTEEPPPPLPAGRPRLRRRADGRIVAGVAGGLADHFGVSALGLRIAFGAAAFVVAFLLLRPWTEPYDSVYYDPRLSTFRGLVNAGAAMAVLTYFALWVFVPREDAGVSAAGRLRHRLPRFPRFRSWVGMLALVAGASLLGAQLGLWSPDVTWAFLLIGFGVMLFRRDAERASARATAAAAPPPAEPVPLPPPVPRERSPLGWMTLGVALLVVSLAAILDNLGAIDLKLVAYPSLALLVIAAGLLVGAFVGRARWLILPGLLIAPMVLVASLVRVPLEGGFADLFEGPRTVAAVRGSYQRAIGHILLDLTALEGKQVTIRTAATTGFGGVQVYVPFDAHVVAAARTGWGSVEIGDGPFRGFDVEEQNRWEPKYGDGATVILDLEVGIGDVWVFRPHPTKRELRELKQEASG